MCGSTYVFSIAVLRQRFLVNGFLSHGLEAASDLGAKRWRGFLDVTLPLSLPGIIAGCLLVFIPAIGEYVIPALLGGADTLMIGRVLFDEFFLNRDWPVASAVAIVLLLLLVLPIVYFQKRQADNSVVAA